MVNSRKVTGTHILGVFFLLSIFLFSGFVSAAPDTTPPSVDAGLDRAENFFFTQDATATDTESGVASYLWTMESGPGNITFGTADTEDTTVEADTEGTYVIRLNVTDNSTNSAFDEFTLIWDTTAPVITVPANFSVNATSLLGEIVTFNVSATDDVDGNVSVICGLYDSGDLFPLGTTTVECDSTDNASNTAIATFTITVQDAAPVITLLGDSVVNIPIGTEYNDSGATANDTIDGDLTANLTNISTVNTAAAGTYTVVYSVNDSSNNSAQATRTVIVFDPTPPPSGGGGGGGGGGSVSKIIICHIPPGNPSNNQTITVAKSAVAAHLAHGDYLGACGASQACVPNWTCTDWSACVDGKQTRVCTDSNSCGVLDNRPEILQDCGGLPTLTSDTSSATKIPGETIKTEEVKKTGFIGKATGNVIGAFGTGGALVALIFVVVLAAALITTMIVLHRQRRMQFIDRSISQYQ